MSDNIKSPAHYAEGAPTHPACGQPVEPITFTQELNFNLGNVVKYVWRAGKKGPTVEDLRKARQYIDFELARLGYNDIEEQA